MYSANQVRRVIKDLGLTIKGDTRNDFQVLCPFHHNTYSPAMSIGKHNGQYICFAPECGVTGNLVDLVKRIAHKNEFEALRYIISRSSDSDVEFEEELEAIMATDEIKTFPQEVLDRLHAGFKNSPAETYMLSRGFDLETMEYFKVGYSQTKDMVTVPVHYVDGTPMGLVGRSIQGKSFMNNAGLQKTRTCFNIHRARASSSHVAILESSFDVMRLHQAGFAAVALLGGTISTEQVNMLLRNFESFVIFTDFDDASKHVRKTCRKCYPQNCTGHNSGRDLGIAIADRLASRSVEWAVYKPYDSVYPHDAKDATDLDIFEVQQCMTNVMNDSEYREWMPY